jgi:hypothetical protein
MKIKEIKKEMVNSMTFCSSYDAVADEIINTYYTPLAESHRELVLAAEGAFEFLKDNQTFAPASFDAINNAKKLINEQR